MDPAEPPTQETIHSALLRFRSSDWRDLSAVAEIAAGLGVPLAGGTSAQISDAEIKALETRVDTVLQSIRDDEERREPAYSRSLFYAGALLLRRPHLLSDSDEDLLRQAHQLDRDGPPHTVLTHHQKLGDLATAGIDDLRKAVAAKWEKRHGGNMTWLTFKTHHEPGVFDDLTRRFSAKAGIATGISHGAGSAARSQAQKPPDPPAPVPGLEAAISDYSRRLRDYLLALHFARSPGGGRSISLDEVFVSLPIPAAITVLVEDCAIAQWTLTHVAGESYDYRTARLDAFDVRWPSELHHVAAGLLPEIDEALRGNVDHEYPNPTDRPCILSAPQADGVKWNIRPLRVDDLALAHHRILLLGRPGSGKSTVARHLALSLLRLSAQHGSERPAQPSVLQQWGDEDCIPIYVSLRDFVRAADIRSRSTDQAIEMLWDYVSKDQLGLPSSVRDLLEPIAREGRLVVILDGLDEVPLPRREEDAKDLKQALERFIVALHAGTPVRFLLVTSRPAGVGSWNLDALHRYELAPLRGRELDQFARKLFRRGSAHTDLAQAFIAALREVPDSLKDRPLFVHLMASVFGESASDESPPTLPKRRSRLYRRSIMLLLDRWTRPREGDASLAARLGCTADELYRRLTAVAYKTHKQSSSSAEEDLIPLAILLEELFALEGESNIRDILAFLSQEAGVLVSPAPDEYHFAHRGFQEFLAASFLASRPDGPELARQHITENLGLWREPCLMLGEALIEEGRPSELWDYIDRLTREIVIAPSALWLAARLVRDETSDEQREGRRNQPLVEGLRESLRGALSGELPLLDLTYRFDLATSLDSVGDTRSGVGVIDGLPDIAWCEIPAGQARVGSSQQEIDAVQQQAWAANRSFDRETPMSTHAFPSLSVARFPVTVAQFRAFLNAQDGYAADEWWLPMGVAFRARTAAEHPLASSVVPSNLPATYVSWFEAVAYCRWLSASLGELVRLPTEAEWERIARGPAETIFPWGNAFDSQLCNSDLAVVGRPMPVGIVPEGRARWDEVGVHDLSGNIWEWTSTAWESSLAQPFSYPYSADDGRESMELLPSARRVVRGGAYLNGPFLCRAAYRGRDHPAARLSRQGFRIVRSPAQSTLADA